MAFIVNDRVKETTTTTGTGAITLAGAVTGFETFGAGIGNSNTTYYCIALQDGTEFEVGFGTLNGSSSTLTRTYIISSSNSDAAVNFSAGTKDVFCTMPAAKVGLPNPEEYGSSSAPKLITVTVASKSGSHPYQGQGSSSAYYLDGLESPALRLSGVDSSYKYYYRFDQSNSTNSGHPLRFYLEADKTTAYTTGVTTNGSPGSSGAYTQIAVDANTPNILYYQCSSHALMGNHTVIISNDFNGDVNFRGNAAVADDKKIQLGAGNDLQIYHDSTSGHSFIKEAGPSSLVVQSNNFIVQNAAGSANIINAPEGAAGLDLYYNGNKKFETTVTGAAVTGALTTTTDVNIGALLKMPTNTANKILVADGTSFEEVDMSGDATIASGGALTIANDAVEQAMIADDAVGPDQLANTSVSAGSYTTASLTVDAQGRLTAASSGSAGASAGFVIAMSVAL